MNNININPQNQQGNISIKTIPKDNNEENGGLLAPEQWEKRNRNILPTYYSDDYAFALHKGYQQYLLNNKERIEQSFYEVLLNDTEIKKITSFTRIFVTFQKKINQGNLQLVLKTHQSDEITLCDISDIEEQLTDSKRMINQQVDFARALHAKIPDFCIAHGQQLLLRITGGFLLKDNILVCSKSL
jgi:hypothetical protein